MEIRARGGCCEDFKVGRVEGEGGDDIAADGGGGGGGQADDGDGGEGLPEVGEVQIRGAEVVAPFADAVGFVDGDAREFALRVDGCEVPTEGLGEAELGGDVEEAGEGMAAAEVVKDAGTFGGRCVGV